ncbi:hypothetical protein ACE6H2_003237 [Prunus campanulata]
MIIGKAAEQLFRISCYQLVVEKGFTNQEEFPDAILQVRGQYRLFQLRFGAIKNDLNRSDLLIQAVFDDIEQLLESSSSPSNQVLVQYEKKDTPGQIFPSTPPPLSKETSTPLTASSTSSPNEPMSASKAKARIAVKKRLFSSLIQTQKIQNVRIYMRIHFFISIYTCQLMYILILFFPLYFACIQVTIQLRRKLT